jgi:hypothetical protein
MSDDFMVVVVFAYDVDSEFLTESDKKLKR